MYKNKLVEIQKYGLERCLSKLSKLKLDVEKHGFWEVSFFIDRTFHQKISPEDFLRLIASNHPGLTGWPLWTAVADNNKEWEPYFEEGGWERIIINGLSVDFWRIEPTGEFYLYRTFEDDTKNKNVNIDFDLRTHISRVAEAIGTALELVRAFDCEDGANIKLYFKWTGLKNRKLISRSDPTLFLLSEYAAQQNELNVNNIEVPVSVQKSNIYRFVNQAIQPLGRVFEGFELSIETVQDLTNKLLNRNS